MEPQAEGEPSAPDLGQGAPAPSISPHHDMLSSMHKQAMAKYQAIATAHELAEEFREELDGLVDKGDAVSDDDVLDAMARLVGKGADPQQLAVVMSGGQGQPPMPTAGPGLAQWCQNMDQVLSQKEEALQGPLAQARMEALGSGVHLLAAHHIHGASASQTEGSAHARGSDSRSQLGASSGPAGSGQPLGNGAGAGGAPEYPQ